MHKEKKAMPVGRGKLRRWVQKSGLTFLGLSKQIGITRSYLSMLMKGTRRPSKMVIMKIRDLTKGEVKFLGDILDKKKKTTTSSAVS